MVKRIDFQRMKTLLVINSSARLTRSITRQLTERAKTNWLATHPAGRVVALDVGLTPPPAVDEAWIAAAYTRPDQRPPGMTEVLRTSDRYIDLLVAADAIVIGAPIYNFGMPAQLKAFFEQVVRIGRTFDFGATRDSPYLGLLADKPVLIAVSSGSAGLEPSRGEFPLNYLEPHMRTILKLMGLTQVTFAYMAGQQAEPEILARALRRAGQAVDAWSGLV